MTHIKLIALDLDGTLLTTDKRLSERNRDALARAAASGIQIVPTTGRIYPGLPAPIRELPFLRYIITANGASVYDCVEKQTLCRIEIPLDQTIEIMRWLEDFPVVYDCYMQDAAFMTESMFRDAEQYIDNPFTLQLVRSLRQPVPELKAFLCERGTSIQKIQVFCHDSAMQQTIMRGVMRRFDRLIVSSSVTKNVEINHADANKGAALLSLAAHLNIDRRDVMAFGDGLNDDTMIRAAGIGVAMENAVDEIKGIADFITASNDDDGVAVTIDRLLAE